MFRLKVEAATYSSG